jgi:hypothetical protein
MIEMPKRSVTRFFIPLVDVMMLLFCIFLLMPLFQGGTNPSAAAKLNPDELRAANARLERERLRLSRLLGTAEDELQRLRGQEKALAQEREKLAQLRKKEMKALQQRLAIHVLEIDGATGKLYAPDVGGRRSEISSAKAAEQLIRRHEQEAGGREVYYLFLFPREDSAYPREEQFDRYKSWFARVPYGIDNPRSRREDR